MRKKGDHKRVNTALYLKKSAEKGEALPVLCWPAAKKLGIPVGQLVKNAESQARVAEWAALNTPCAAPIMPMDLSVEAEAFGARVRFTENEVPCVTGAPVRDAEDAEALSIPPLTAARLPMFIDAVRRAKPLTGEKPLLAGMIGPFSLAGRLMDPAEIMYACMDEPETVHAVLKKATAFLREYGLALKNVGADGLLLAEPLAGLLSPDMAQEFAHTCTKELISALRSDSFAVIYHNCGGSVPRMLDKVFALGADAYHFGNCADMGMILRAAPDSVLCMGNIDPVALFTRGTPEEMTEAVRSLKKACPQKNFMLSSGCDIPYDAPWENILAFYRAAAEAPLAE